MKERICRRTLLPLGAALLLLISMLLSLRLGSEMLNTASFFGGLFRREGYRAESLILYSLRVPRTLAGLLAGAGLALSGTLLRHATDNPLAAPNIIGINAGAGFFVIVALSLFPAAYALLPFFAFAGAMLTALAVLAIARKAGSGKTAVVLCGVAFSALFGAGISFFSVLDDEVLASYTDFSIGGLAGVSLKELWMPAIILICCFAGALLLSRRLRLFCLGDTLAGSLGVSVPRIRMLSLILAAASAAAAVSFAGLIGFVGLLVPHITARLAKNDLLTELILSPLCGGILLILADLLGRMAFAPSEVPVGIFTALLGVPFFLTLLLRRDHHAGM